jgi:tol-pal system protein YbgF
MMRYTVPSIAAVATAVVLALPGPAAAQNREHQQLVAEVRILHEQVQRLHLTANTLLEQLAATNSRLDTQADAVRKSFADLQVRVDALGADLSTVRENLYDNTTRVSKLSQELDAIRTGIGSMTALLTQIVALLTPTAGEPIGDPAGPPVATPPGTTGTPPTVPPPATTTPPANPLQPPVNVASPSGYMSSALGFYYAGEFNLAIEAFTDFLGKFPDSPDAADAQFYIGESHYSSDRYKDAMTAYGLVISKYEASPRVPDAYYKQGLSYERLNQRPNAIKNYQLLRQTYPDTTAGGHATQALIRLGIIKD